MTTDTFETKTPPAGHTPRADVPAVAGPTLAAQPCNNSMAARLNRRRVRIGLMEAKILPQFKREFFGRTVASSLGLDLFDAQRRRYISQGVPVDSRSPLSG